MRNLRALLTGTLLTLSLAATATVGAQEDGDYDDEDIMQSVVTLLYDVDTAGRVVGVKTTPSATRDRADVVIADVLGGNNDVESLYDRGIYLESFDDGEVFDTYIAVSNLSLNNEDPYDAHAMTFIREDSKDSYIGVAYATVWYNPTSEYITLYGDTPNAHVVDHDINNYLVAMTANQVMMEEYYAPSPTLYAEFLQKRAKDLTHSASGEVATLLAPVQFESLFNFTSAVKDSLNIAHTSGQGFAPGTSRDRSGYDILGGWRLWGTPNATFAKRNAGSGYMGYTYDEYSFILGVDKRILGNDLIVGAAIGYGYGDFNAYNSRIESYMDVLHLEAYAAFEMNAFFMNAGLGYSHYWYRNLRDKNLRTNNGGSDGHSVNAFLQAGYRFDWCNWVFLPTLGFDFARADADSYTMGGGAVGGSRVFSHSPDAVNSYRTPLQLAIMRDFDGLIGSLRMGWTHEWGSNRPRATNAILSDTGVYNKFRVRGRELPQNYYNVGLGLDFNVSRFATSVAYDYTFGDDHYEHQLQLRAGVSF